MACNLSLYRFNCFLRNLEKTGLSRVKGQEASRLSGVKHSKMCPGPFGGEDAGEACA